MFLLKVASFDFNKFIDSLKNENIIEKMCDLKFSFDQFHIYLMLLGFGSLVGFVTKRYLRLIFVSLVVALLIIKGLESQHIINVDWVTLTKQVGLSIDLSFEDALKNMYNFAVNNVYFSLTIFLGLIIGYRAG